MTNTALSPSFIEELRGVLKQAGVRPTQHRLALAHLLFHKGNRHVTAERIHFEALDIGIHISLATVYNTLNCFLEAGLLREVCVSKERCYFDTNTQPHAHLYDQEKGELYDAPLPDSLDDPTWKATLEMTLHKNGLIDTSTNQVDLIFHIQCPRQD